MKNKIWRLANIVMFLCFSMNSIVYAGSLAGSPLVDGTKKLIADGTTILTGLVAGITILFAVKNAIVWNISSEHDKPGAQKRFIRDLGIGVVGTVISGLVSVILSYYGG